MICAPLYDTLSEPLAPRVTERFTFFFPVSVSVHFAAGGPTSEIGCDEVSAATPPSTVGTGRSITTSPVPARRDTFIVEGGRDPVTRMLVRTSLAFLGGAVVIVHVAPSGHVNDPSPPLVNLHVSSPFGQGFES